MTTAGVFNSFDGPLVVSTRGHQLEAGGFLSVEDLGGADALEAAPIAGHLEAERLVKVDQLPEDYEPRPFDRQDPEPDEAPIDPEAAASSVQGDATEQLEAAEAAAQEPAEADPTPDPAPKATKARKRTTQE